MKKRFNFCVNEGLGTVTKGIMFYFRLGLSLWSLIFGLWTLDFGLLGLFQAAGTVGATAGLPFGKFTKRMSRR